MTRFTFNTDRISFEERLVQTPEGMLYQSRKLTWDVSGMLKAVGEWTTTMRVV